MKTYTSKNGNSFRISEYPLPRDGETVHITSRIFDWLKSKKANADEFTLIWKLIYDDHTYDPIPDDEIKTSKELAAKWGPLCVQALRGKQDEPEGI